MPMTTKKPENNFSDEEFIRLFHATCEKNDLLDLTEGKEEKFLHLARMAVEFNSHTNITAINDIGGLILSHFCDSLTVARLIPQSAQTTDVGCGGGFPTLPLAIVRPDIGICAIDSTGKKLAFVSDAARELGLARVTPRCMRAEDGGKDPTFREHFDFVTARAVSAMPILCELCLPFLRIGGIFCAMKGPRGGEELDEAKNALSVLGGTLREVKKITLCPTDSAEPLERMLLIVEKTSPAPAKYPRAYGKIKNKPL